MHKTNNVHKYGNDYINKKEDIMDYRKTAQEIYDHIGKKENIISAAHCATRLRLVIGDNSKADKEYVENIEGVKGVSLSLPTVINKKGVFHVISPKLSDDERAKLKSSAEIMKEYTDKALAMIEENK